MKCKSEGKDMGGRQKDKREMDSGKGSAYRREGKRTGWWEFVGAMCVYGVGGGCGYYLKVKNSSRLPKWSMGCYSSNLYVASL